MSLIAVQAGVANYVVTRQPEEAARALSSIEKISRSALREMRALLGVLRDEETAAEPARQATGTWEGWYPRRDWRTWTVWSTGPARPASGWTSTSAASGPRFPPGWTWRPTG